MDKLLLAGFLFTISAFAEQAFTVGVIGGAPFTDVATSATQGNLAVVPTSTNFTVGPVVQVNLPLGLRVEGDALYRPYSFSETPAATSVVVSSVPPAAIQIVKFLPSTVSAAQWRFPVMVQYRFKGLPLLKPFVGVGASFEHLSNISAAASNITAGPGQLLNSTNAGVVLVGGVDVKIPLVRISAELRYTHQGSGDFQSVTNLNQAEFLLGVHF